MSDVISFPLLCRNDKDGANAGRNRCIHTLIPHRERVVTLPVPVGSLGQHHLIAAAAFGFIHGAVRASQ